MGDKGPAGRLPPSRRMALCSRANSARFAKSEVGCPCFISSFSPACVGGTEAVPASPNQKKKETMIHQTKNEKTPNIYESTDALVSVRVLDVPKRYPRNKYKLVVFRFIPKAYSRIRHLGKGLFEFLPTNEEIQAFVEAFQKASGKKLLNSKRRLKNKPAQRKMRWDKINQRRFAPSRPHPNNRRNR
jgi:hypothetical protein